MICKVGFKYPGGEAELWNQVHLTTKELKQLKHKQLIEIYETNWFNC